MIMQGNRDTEYKNARYVIETQNMRMHKVIETQNATTQGSRETEYEHVRQKRNRIWSSTLLGEYISLKNYIYVRVIHFARHIYLDETDGIYILILTNIVDFDFD